MSFLIISSFIILTLLISKITKSTIREAFLSAAILWGLYVVITTETLSLFNAITPLSISLAWVILNIFCIFLLYFIPRKLKNTQSFNAIKIPHLESSERSILIGIFLISGALELIAFLAPPNTWDSMVYHMSRIVHWIQNHNVNFYPTGIIRQLVLPPFSEFSILHFQILSASDEWANFIQYFSMIGSLIGVSLIASRLGANRFAQIMTAALAVSIPMGIAQATSTQTDYVAAFWITTFVYFVLDNREMFSWRKVFYLAGALSLGLLTKGTVYLYSPPFLFWFLITIKKRGLNCFLKTLSLLFVLILLINSGHWMRNQALSQSIFSKNELPKVMNERYGPDVLGSNIIRNTALHLGTISNTFCENLTQWIIQAHAIVGMDAADPETSFTKKFIVQKNLAEDTTGNFRHFLLAIFSLFLFLFSTKSFKKTSILNPYLLCLLSGFIIFCWTVKWQPWHSRLHLPLFVLATPWIAVVLFKRLKKEWLFGITLILLITSLPWVLRNPARRMQSTKKATIFNTARMDQYFANFPEIREPYKKAAQYIHLSGCQNVGLLLGSDFWEYPLWALLQFQYKSSVRIEHVNVVNLSQKYSQTDFVPCLILIDKKVDKQKSIIVNDRTFTPVIIDFISVLEVQ